VNPIWYAILATDFTFSDITALKVPSVSPLCRYLYSFVYPAHHAHTYISGLTRNFPHRRKRWKSAFHERAEPAYCHTSSRGSRSYLPDEYSSISTVLSPELLYRFRLRLLLLLRSTLFAVSNLYRRCRTPPATGQIIHYGARACTRHVARGEARFRKTGKRYGGRSGSHRRSSTPKKQREKEKRKKKKERKYVRECVCVCNDLP